MKLLLVDDSRERLDELCAYLNELGIEHDVFLSPLDAISAYRSGRYSAVLSEMFMYELNGLELLKAIRAFNEHAKVILMSRLIFGTMRESAFDKGAFELIAHSDIRKLSELLSRIALENERPVRKAVAQ